MHACLNPGVIKMPHVFHFFLQRQINTLAIFNISCSYNLTIYGVIVIFLLTCVNLDMPSRSLQIVEFISVLLTVGSETAEKELINQSAIKRSIDLFFE